MKRIRSLHEIILGLLAPDAAAAQRWAETSPIIGIEDEAQSVAAANRYWRVQLGQLESDSTEARSSLVDHINFDMWLYDFTQYVLPVILANQLPR